MNTQLLELIVKLQSDESLNTLNETATKQAIILGILHCLGWNPFDVTEVCPEFSVREKRVDYALRSNGQSKVFIEVKQVGVDLEKHQEQLLKYAFEEGVKLAILTNGIAWWFYLPLHEGNWEQRKFYTIELRTQDGLQIRQKFEQFLSKKTVVSGEAVEQAEALHTSQQRRCLIHATIPKAWGRLVAECDELLMELVAEMTEKLCGYRPEQEDVVAFLTRGLASAVGAPPSGCKVMTFQKKPKLVVRPAPKKQSYANKKIVAYLWRGERHEVDTWRDMLMGICDRVAVEKGGQFDEVTKLAGRKCKWFSYNPDDLRAAEKVAGTSLFVEKHSSADAKVRLCQRMLSLFGYQSEDLVIETK